MLNIDFKTPVTYIHSKNNVMHPSQDVFEIYNADKTVKMGELVCHKTNAVSRPDYEGPILAIDYLKSNIPNKGLGRAIINFAQKLSAEMGCQGYMVLKADSTFDKEKIPHIFYKKLGFSTFDKKIDKQMDKFIKQNKPATIKDFPCILMHYPALMPKSSNFKMFYQTIIKNILKF